MPTLIESAELWPKIRRVFAKDRKWAAVAYLGKRPPLSFGRDDLLVVDASNPMIKSGVTSARTLATLHRLGVELRSFPGLHAKIIVSARWAVIGSMNLSAHSEDGLQEAGVLSDSSSFVAMAHGLIRQIADRATKLSKSEISRLLMLPVDKQFRTSTVRKGKRLARTTRGRNQNGPALWILSLADGRDEVDEGSLEEFVLDSARKKVEELPDGADVWTYAHRRNGPLRNVQAGDQIVHVWASRRNGIRRVYPPRPVVEARNRGHKRCIAVAEYGKETKLAVPVADYKRWCKGVSDFDLSLPQFLKKVRHGPAKALRSRWE